MTSYLNCPYEDFPRSGAHARGMRVLDRGFAALAAAGPHATDGLPLAPGTTLHRAVPYREASGRTLHLHVIVPDGASADAPAPLVVYVQGSAFHEQNVDGAIGRLSSFAARGFVVAIVQYRPSEVAPFPAQAADARWAIQFMVEHADDYGADPGRIVAWGDSSGGHTALMAAFAQGDPVLAEPGLAEHPVAALVDFFAPVAFYEMNLEPSACDHLSPDCPEGMELGGVEVTPEASAAADLRRYVAGCSAPVLVCHGDKDRLVPFAQSCLLTEALLDAGKEVELWQLRDADHGGGPFWTEGTLDLVEGFVRRSLARGQA